MSSLAKRRAAKALRRKAVVQAKRKAELAGEGKGVAFGGESSAPALPTRKASAALLDVAEILEEDGDDHGSWHKKLIIAMMAWNLSLLPVAEREKKMREFIETLIPTVLKAEQENSPIDRDDVYDSFAETITALITRKLLLYPLDRRCLIDLDVLERPNGCRVNVTSVLDTAA